MRIKAIELDDGVWGTALAAVLAQEMDLPEGNMWEPPMARRAATMARVLGRERAEGQLRFQLGMDQKDIT